MATSTPVTQTQRVHTPVLHDLHLDRLSSGDWQSVSSAVGASLHPALSGSLLSVTAQSVLRSANSERWGVVLLALSLFLPKCLC